MVAESGGRMGRTASSLEPLRGLCRRLLACSTAFDTMPSNLPTLTYVQQAGQAVSTAREQLHAQLQRQVEKLASVVAAQPFGPDADRAYAQLRAVARMTQELQSIEDQLVQVYKAAAQFEEGQDIQVLVALPRHGTLAAAVPVDDVVDAKEVPARRAGRQAQATRHPRDPQPTVATASRQRAKVSNEVRMLEGLRKVLNRRGWTEMTQTQMAQAAGIPQGSVGAALARVIASGQVLVGERGRYRLA